MSESKLFPSSLSTFASNRSWWASLSNKWLFTSIAKLSINPLSVFPISAVKACVIPPVVKSLTKIVLMEVCIVSTASANSWIVSKLRLSETSNELILSIKSLSSFPCLASNTWPSTAQSNALYISLNSNSPLALVVKILLGRSFSKSDTFILLWFILIWLCF